jgi:hypothetical protein
MYALGWEAETRVSGTKRKLLFFFFFLVFVEISKRREIITKSHEVEGCLAAYSVSGPHPVNPGSVRPSAHLARHDPLHIEGHLQCNIEVFENIFHSALV